MVEAVEQVGIVLKVTLKKLPNGKGIKSDDTLKNWLIKEKGITDGDIKWCRFRPCYDHGERLISCGSATVVLRNEDAANKVRSGCQEEALSEEYSSQREEWGRKVRITLPSNTDYSKLKQTYGLPEAASECAHRNDADVHTMKIMYLQRSVTEADIIAILPEYLRPQKLTFQEQKNDLQNAHLEFSNSSSMEQAYLQINASRFCQPSKSNRRGAKLIKNSHTTRIDVTLRSSEDALKACKMLTDNNLTCVGTATVEVVRAKLFRNLDGILADIKTKFEVEIHKRKTQKSPNNLSITFSSSNPLKCGQAAQNLHSQTTPLFLKIKDRKQQLMLFELKDRGKLQDWATCCGLDVETTLFENRKHKDSPQEKLVYSMQVWGPEVAQGNFMAQIADYSDGFENRYYQYPLGLEYAQFKRGKKGATSIIKLDENLGEDGDISVVHHIQAIEVILHFDVADPIAVKSRVEDDIKKLLLEFGVSHDAQSAARRANACISCKEDGASIVFEICGHKMCKSCFSAKAETTAKFPIRCPVPECQTLIYIRDFERTLDKNVFELVCCNSVMEYLQENKHHPLGRCPVPNCTGILPKQNGYSVCHVCNTWVCCICGTINDKCHQDITCKAYRRLKISLRVFNINKLFEDAEIFVNDNWKREAGDVLLIERNPGLINGCPSMQKFSKAIIQMGGISTYNGASFFGWHGTKTMEGVIGICHDGFNPSFRSGQCYGVGEYFGMSNAVSHGYAGATGLMIVAQLLRAPCQSTHSNFCYVVNNPLDWKIAFNLPVLVVHYGSGKATSLSFRDCEKTALPFKDDENSEDLEADANEDTNGFESKYESVYRWQWQEDGGRFNNYNDEINSLIESNYHQLKGLSLHLQTFETPEIVRYLDDKPQKYIIDFALMKQRNAKTSYPRSIRRHCIQSMRTYERSVWEFYDASKKWRPYDSLCNDQIEASYKLYAYESSGAAVVEIVFPGRPEKYAISFLAPMKQTNLETKKCRAIRRVTAKDRSLKPKHFGESIRLLIEPQVEEDELKEIAARIRSVVKSTVHAGLGKACDDWDQPILNFHESMIDMTITGLTKSLAGLIVGKIRSALNLLFNCDAKILQLASEPSAEFRTWLSENPRLMKLATNRSPFPLSQPCSREDVVLLVAHTIIWQLGFKVYGGFVRDWAVRGEEANDIDSSVPPTIVNLHNVGRDLGDRLKGYGIVVTNEKQTGAAWTIVMRKEDWGNDVKSVDLDMVHDSFSSQAPGADCDCGNLCINNTGQLVKKCDAGGSVLPLVKCLRHCTKKRFVFFYSLSDNIDVATRRLKKYFTRGWTCIGMCTSASGDNSDQAFKSFVLKINPKFLSLVNLKPKYCRPWNTIKS